MNDKVGIYYFSGTGNTYLVVTQLAKSLRETGRTVTVKRMESHDPAAALAGSEAVLGLAFPVAAQGTYPLVWDFVRRLPEGGGAQVFMLDTLAGYSGGVVEPLGELLQKKGYVLLGACEIIMPSNFMRRRVETQRDFELVEKGLLLAQDFAAALASDKAHWPVGSLRAKFFNAINRGCYSTRIFARIFSPHVDEKLCNGCGRCFNACPVGNIEMRGGVAHINRSCQACMRCLGICPQEAVRLRGAQPYKAADLLEMLTDESDK